MGETVEQTRRGNASGEALNPKRRAVLQAIAKYAGAAGVAGTFTVLSAEDAVAKQPCSEHPEPQPGQNCDNGSGGGGPGQGGGRPPWAGGPGRSGAPTTQGFQTDTTFFGDGSDSTTRSGNSF